MYWYLLMCAPFEKSISPAIVACQCERKSLLRVTVFAQCYTVVHPLNYKYGAFMAQWSRLFDH